MSSLFVDVHRWRRLGWLRIILYLLCFLLAVHLFRSFTPSTQSSLYSNNNYSNVTVHDFPWYKAQGNPSLTHLQNRKYTTAHLSTKQREELQQKMVLKAKERVASEFSSTVGIPGSIYHNDAINSAKFRERVDCWTTQGEWVQVPSRKNIMPHFQDPLYGSCDRKFYKSNSKEEQREAVKYVWKSKCDALEEVEEEMDRDQWCEVIQGRHLLLVGDLVQYQLHELFLDTLRDGPAVCFGELNCKDHTICGGELFRETRLRYLRNDILSVRRKMNYNHGHPKADVIEWPFTSSALMRGYPIVILNRAPVIESDEKFIEGLIETVKVMRKASPNSLILYRSTGIGHPFCNDAQGPLKEHLTDEQLRLLPFGWSELTRRNAIARVIIEAAGGVFIDLAASSDLRPDGHIGGQDCMRYCIPGPLDSWAQILYKVFLGLEGKL